MFKFSVVSKQNSFNTTNSKTLNMYRKQLLVFLVLSNSIHTSFSFPNNDFRQRTQDTFDIYHQGQNVIREQPKALNNILNWGVSKIKNGQKNLKTLWNGFTYKVQQPWLKRSSYLVATERTPQAPASVPSWRNLVSKAWSFVGGFFQRSERYFANRRMDTDRQWVFPALVPAAPAWAMPLAMVGVAVLLTGPLELVSNGLSVQRDPELVSSMVPLPVSSALKYIGGPSMLSYYTPNKVSTKLSSTVDKVSNITYKVQHVSSNALSVIGTKSNLKFPKAGDKTSINSEYPIVQKKTPPLIIASVTLMEENYSGVKGEIQLVQDSESNHVMITGAIKGLSPGFHGIYVHIGTTCFDRIAQNNYQEKSSYKKELGSIITYPFESSAVVFIIEDELSLKADSPTNILNASFVILENNLDSIVACGNVEQPDTSFSFVDLKSIDDIGGVSGQLVLKQEIGKEKVAISGKIKGLGFDSYGLWISMEEEKTRMCARSDDEINIYMNNRHATREGKQNNDLPNILIPVTFDSGLSASMNTSDVSRIENTFESPNNMSSLVGHSMIFYNSTKHQGHESTFGNVSITSESSDVLGCGVILPQTHIVAVAELVDTNGQGITGRLIFSQLYPSKEVIVVGIIYRLKFGPYRLFVENSDPENRCKDVTSNSNLYEITNRAPKGMKNYNGELGSIISRNSVGPTSVFVINEDISLHKSSPESIINHSITVKSGFNQFKNKPGEKHGNKSASSTVACGVIELCDINCQKSLSLAGAEI